MRQERRATASPPAFSRRNKRPQSNGLSCFLLALMTQNMVRLYERMIETQTTVSAPNLKLRKILMRILTFLFIAACVGAFMRHLSTTMDKSATPAGFVRGMLQGALMPGALPNLAVGHDVPIYAINNTGLTYKLGYTFGGNACGLIFFGLFFWRVSKWKRK